MAPTISTSVILGVDRAKAARFSFLMVVPLILGAALLDVKKFRDINELESLAAEERTELIMADLIEDQVVSETEFSSVRMAVLQKEKRWDFFKAKIGNNMGEGALGRESELTKEFSMDLEARVKAATRSGNFDASMAGVRPLSPIGLWTLFVGFLTAFGNRPCCVYLDDQIGEEIKAEVLLVLLLFGWNHCHCLQPFIMLDFQQGEILLIDKPLDGLLSGGQ